MKIKNLLIIDLEDDNFVGRVYWNKYHYFKSMKDKPTEWNTAGDSSIIKGKRIIWDCKTIEECVKRTKDDFIRHCLSWAVDHEGIDPQPLPLTLKEAETATIDYADVGSRKLLSENTVAIYFVFVDTEIEKKNFGWDY